MPKTTAEQLNQTLMNLYQVGRPFKGIRIRVPQAMACSRFNATDYYKVVEIIDSGNVMISLRSGHAGSHNCMRTKITVASDQLIHWRRA